MTPRLADPLPEAAVLLHVGPPKTGSTAVQGAFRQVKPELARLGVRCPGKERRAKQPLVDLVQGAGGGAWAKLVGTVGRRSSDRIWVSNEDFASVGQETADTMVRDLGGERVRVVYVVRPLDKLLPSQWQQRVRRTRNAPSYDEWLREVLGDEPTAAHQHFWARHDIEAQVAKWSSGDPSRIHFVVAKEGDHDYLLRVFEDLMAIPTGTLVAEPGANSSLTLSGAELVRELNRLADEYGIDEQKFRQELKPGLSKLIRSMPRDPADDAITMPRWAAARVAELDERRATFLRSRAGQLVGDPSSLVGRAIRLRDSDEQVEPRISSRAAAAMLAWAFAQIAPADPAAPVASDVADDDED